MTAAEFPARAVAELQARKEKAMTPKQRAEEAREIAALSSSWKQMQDTIYELADVILAQQAEHEAGLEQLNAKLTQLEQQLNAKLAQLERDGPMVDGGYEIKTDGDDRPVGDWKGRRIPMRQALAEMEQAADWEAHEADALREKLAALTAPGEYGGLILRLRKTYSAGPGAEAVTAIEQLQAKLAEYREDAERLLTALDDSTALLRRVKDENDEGGIADQIADNITAMKGKP